MMLMTSLTNATALSGWNLQVPFCADREGGLSEPIPRQPCCWQHTALPGVPVPGTGTRPRPSAPCCTGCTRRPGSAAPCKQDSWNAGRWAQPCCSFCRANPQSSVQQERRAGSAHPAPPAQTLLPVWSSWRGPTTLQQEQSKTW